MSYLYGLIYGLYDGILQNHLGDTMTFSTCPKCETIYLEEVTHCLECGFTWDEPYADYINETVLYNWLQTNTEELYQVLKYLNLHDLSDGKISFSYYSIGFDFLYHISIISNLQCFSICNNSVCAYNLSTASNFGWFSRNTTLDIQKALFFCLWWMRPYFFEWGTLAWTLCYRTSKEGFRLKKTKIYFTL